MAQRRLQDQKIGQMGSSFDINALNAELDLLHDRLNRIIDGGDMTLARKFIETSSYIIDGNDSYIGVDTRTQAVTLTLPRGDTAIPNRLYFIKDEGNNAGTNNITVYAAGTDTIDKGQTKSITSNSGSITAFWTGTEWFSL